MNSTEGLLLSWVGSFLTIMWVEESIAVLSGLGTIVLTATLIVKNVQEIKKKREEMDK